MIPDFPVEKENMMNYWMKYLSKKHKVLLGVFGNLPAYRNHEGHKWTLDRSDGSKDSQPYHEIQAMLNLKISEIPDLSPEKLRLKLDKLAEDMARQASQSMFAEISRVTNQVGNAIDAKGQPLTKELFLQMLDNLDLDFDENGNWNPPTIVMHPDLWAAKKDEFKSWENDPEFQAKQTKIIARKRGEWHDRENRRKLVD